jgi:hypothetical protein
MLPSAVREFFLLERAQRSLASAVPAQRARMLAYARAAERRARAAPSLADLRTAVAAATLFRDAVQLFVRAVLVSRSAELDEPAANLADASKELRRLLAADPSAPPELERAAAALATTDRLYFDHLSDLELGAVGAALQTTLAWLRAQVDLRSETNLRGTRVGRLAAVGVFLLYLASLGVGGVVHLVRPNLARGKTVTESSAWPGSAPSGALVDGETGGSAGPETKQANIFHTNQETAPWAMIDLGAVHPLHEVRVYNRTDHNFDDGLPFSLELSEDGAHFETAARRTTHFGGGRFDPPWSVKFSGKKARFVRVKSEHFLALTEVEVY